MQCTLCVVVDLLCVCGNSYSGTSMHMQICRSMHVDIEVINRNGLSTITVDFLIETVL